MPRTGSAGNSPGDERQEYTVPSGKAEPLSGNCVGLTSCSVP